MLLPTPRSIVCTPTYVLIATHFDVAAYIGRKVLHFRCKRDLQVPGASTYVHGCADFVRWLHLRAPWNIPGNFRNGDGRYGGGVVYLTEPLVSLLLRVSCYLFFHPRDLGNAPGRTVRVVVNFIDRFLFFPRSRV